MFNGERAWSPNDKRVLYREASLAWNKVCIGRQKEMDRIGYERGHSFRLNLSQQMHRMCQECHDSDSNDIFIPRIHLFGSFTEKDQISMYFDFDVL